ncbi:MAG: glycosyltransferase family 4 protein [Bacteroidia bacterium]|nr:glycosyltransferase family 4 protein [Bacteroidia bacterium]
MRILILYSELAGYVLSCIENLLKKEGIKVLLFRWPVNKEAPFNFDFDQKMEIFDREQLSHEEIQKKVDEFDPDAALISGWMDKGYLKIARGLRKKGKPVISGLDNQWTGSNRQKLASLLSPVLVKRNFDMMWVTGLRQQEYAQRLGFAPSHIQRGFYSANWPAFASVYKSYHQKKKEAYPRKLLYVGRLIDFKGIGDLCEAFLDVKNNQGWSLSLVGAGDYPIPDHPLIHQQGFVQPEELPHLAEDAGAFILPSHKEPWGVVLHEFGASGLPLLASDACGAGDAFIKDGENGYIFQAQSSDKLREKLEVLFAKTDEELWEMGNKSYELSQQITPDTWTDTLISMVNNFNQTDG